MNPEFQTAFDGFLAAAQAKIDAYWAAMKYTHTQSPVLEYNEGRRFISVFKVDRDKDGNKTPQHGRSIHSFIDLTGGTVEKVATKVGDILKPASWQKPAKHARGSIFAADFGASCLTHHGPEYLR